MPKAMKKGFSLWRAHLGDALAYILVNAAVMLMAAAPLMCLISKDAGLHWGALLSPVLLVLLVLPLRRNAAAVLRGVCRGECAMNDISLVISDRYREKLVHGLIRLALLLVWAAPGIAATVYAVNVYKGVGGVDSITVMMQISKMGGGDIIRGFEYVLLIYAACWLPLCVGMAFHCGDRHAFAMGEKLPKGTRGRLMLTWLCSIVTALPFLIASAVIVATQIGPVAKNLKTFQIEAAIAMLKPMGIQMLIAFVVLAMPLIPLRHLMIAACVHCDGAKE